MNGLAQSPVDGAPGCVCEDDSDYGDVREVISNLAIPEDPTPIHEIATDYPRGIEAYWQFYATWTRGCLMPTSAPRERDEEAARSAAYRPVAFC